MCLAQYTVDSKSNEIKAIPVILDWLDIKGCTITIDAMGCQREIASQVVKKEGDYILAVKENQKTLHTEVVNAFEKELYEVQPSNVEITENKGHGRIEKRECRVLHLEQMENWSLIEQWKNLQSIKASYK